jgi:type IV pilus assembly protein PilY1
MWELSPAQFPNLGYTINTPCVLSVGNEWNNETKQWSSGKWFLVLGSGPTDYDGGSSQAAHVYILDLATGAKLRDITASTANSFVNSPVAFDKAMNYNVDGVYYAVNYEQGGWESLIQKITIPQNNTEFNPLRTNYDDDVNDWYVYDMVDLQGEIITAPFTLSNDRKGNVWLFAGTGKYMSQADKISADQHYLYGIKDPFFNYDADNRTNCYYEYGKTCQADPKRLYDAGQYEVYEDEVTGLSGGSTFNDLLEEARDAAHDGWYRELCSGSLDSDGNCLRSGPSERVINKPAILGGVVLAPTFAPSEDPCGFGGYGRLFALYYETGTAYRKSVVGQDGDKILDMIPLGEGLSSSFGIHVGQEEGGMVFGQLSTGVIQQFQVIPALRIKSAPVYWKEEE